MAKLIEHTILKQDQRVADIKVWGDPIPEAYIHESPYLKHATVHYTEIPVLLKIVKFLLLVLQRELRMREAESETVRSLGSGRTEHDREQDKRNLSLPEFEEMFQV